MDVQNAIDAAIHANSAVMANGITNEIFRSAYKNAIKVRTSLKPTLRNWLSRHTSFPLVFTNEFTPTHDHPLLAAMREVVRQTFDAEYRIKQASLKVLIIGSSKREVGNYFSNPNVHHHIPMMDGKDTTRSLIPVLDDLAKKMRVLARKKDPKFFKTPQPNFVMDAAVEGNISFNTLPVPNDEQVKDITKRYLCFQQVIDDFVNLHKLPNNIHMDYVTANVLVFEDSIYNFSPQAIYRLFETTNADVAYGYALFPPELLFDDMPENQIYYFKTYHKTEITNDNLEPQPKRIKYAELSFRNGYCNGYTHQYDCWKTLLKNLVIHGSNFDITVEFTSRVGCMWNFKLYRCLKPERVNRTISLTEDEMFVRVLDIYKSANRRTGEMHEFVYFSVRASEYFELYNYGMALADASVSIANLITFIRRKMGGISLINSNLISPWDLQPKQMVPLAITTFMEINICKEKYAEIMEKSDVTGSSLKHRLKELGKLIIYPLVKLYEWLMKERLTDKLIMWPEHGGTLVQRDKVMAKHKNLGVTSPAPDDSHGPFTTHDNHGGIDLIVTNLPTEEELKAAEALITGSHGGCDFCRGLIAIGIGDQKIECLHKEGSAHNFALSDDDVRTLFVSLADDDQDPPGLKEVKKRAKDNLPTAGFSNTVPVEYIRAGPGCGKSDAIRRLAKENDIVLAPFTRLKADYMGLRNEDGERYDLNFKTIHRSLECKSARYIFVDEFTSFDYRFLAALVELTRPEMVFLVGDERQCRLREPEEGVYIGNHNAAEEGLIGFPAVNLDTISTHELLVNFRNPKPVVEFLNRKYGYHMIPHNESEGVLEFVDIQTIGDYTDPGLRMCYSTRAASTYLDNKRLTVRAHQGMTTKVNYLYVTVFDDNLVHNDPMNIVALSRHTDKLYIVNDNSTAFSHFKDATDIDSIFTEHVMTFNPGVDTHVDAVAYNTEEKLIPPEKEMLEHPPMDAHLIAPEIMHEMNPLSTDPELYSQNEEASKVVKQDFRSAIGNIEYLTGTAINARGHPVNFNVQAYQMGTGDGNRYDDDPWKEVKVAQARYDNPKPRFKCDPKAQALADDMVNEYFADCKFAQEDKSITGFLAKATEDNMISVIIKEFGRDAIKKSYLEKVMGGKAWDLLDNPENVTVRFYLKALFKPSSSMKFDDLFKAGQGISSWSPFLLSQMCLCFRILQHIDILTNRNDKYVNILTDNGQSDVEFLTDLMQCLKRLPPSVMFGIVDAVMFDSDQNEFSQLVERKYWTKLGVSEQFLRYYYSFRSYIRITGRAFNSILEFEKASGEPGTLVNNGVVEKVFGNYILRCALRNVQAYKGDDLAKCGVKMYVDTKRQALIEAFCPLKLRITISTKAEFCGLTIAKVTTDHGVEVSAVPNIYRKLNKIYSHRFRDYKHFTQYQESLRDYCDLVRMVGVSVAISHVQEVFKMSPQRAQAIWDSIVAFCHINRKQWLEMSHVVERRFAAPVADDVSPFGVVINE